MPPKQKKLTPLAGPHPFYGGKSLSRKMPVIPNRHVLSEDTTTDEDDSDDEVGIDQGGLFPITEGCELEIVH